MAELFLGAECVINFLTNSDEVILVSSQECFVSMLITTNPGTIHYIMWFCLYMIHLLGSETN